MKLGWFKRKRDVAWWTSSYGARGCMSNRMDFWLQQCRCTKEMHWAGTKGNYSQGNGMICMSKCRRYEEDKLWQLRPQYKPEPLLFIVEIKPKDPNGPFCFSNPEMELGKRKRMHIDYTAGTFWQWDLSGSGIDAKSPLGTSESRLCEMNVS